MCGIGGIYFKKEVNLKIKNCFKERVKSLQSHRGPDAFSECQVTENLFFFHNRLSIIDVVNAQQPMEDEEGVITYNGEIYNFNDLKISSETYRFKSDTEVLLKGLNNRGINFLNKTTSMFAFCYFNKASKDLILARDRIGIKQVYYIDTDEIFAFSSTLGPIVMFSKKQLNHNALWEFYLNRAFKCPSTIFSDIFELEAGSYLSVSQRQNHFSLAKQKWWAYTPQEVQSHIKEAEAIDLIEHHIHQAVRSRLISDVPLGTFLSGGIDSSLVTSIASKYTTELNTFTVAMKDKRYDESTYAKEICAKYNLIYNEIEFGVEDFINSIDFWIKFQDDIVADPSALLLFKLSELAKELGFKVMLSGEGGDELFGGYLSYGRLKKSIHLYRYLKYFEGLAGITTSMFAWDSRIYNFLKNSFHHPRFFGTALIIEPHLLKTLVKGKQDIKFADTIRDALTMDVKDRLPNDLLCRTDRATMAASIEARVPLLDHTLLSYSSILPESLLIKGYRNKYILTKIAEKYIPKKNIYRKKVGFDLPIGSWLRNELKGDFLDLMETSVQQDFINLDMIRNIFKNHISKRINAAGKLWAFFCIEKSFRYLITV
jgi:asparagine synthase (glutamine-hydrolysing)